LTAVRLVTNRERRQAGDDRALAAVYPGGKSHCAGPLIRHWW
jgi:hypothetical protein